MASDLAPILATIVIAMIGAMLGIGPTRKLIEVREAKHELRHGSPGFLRTVSGWIVIAIWLASVWFGATIMGDWWQSGDLDRAIARSGDRLRILLEILAALADD